MQIGSALASTLGQLVRMSETRLRIIVACGAAGGIAATFNAPLTGLFFGFEIVLREFSLDALVATGLAAVTGDVISRAIFGSAPFFAHDPARPLGHQRHHLPAGSGARAARRADRDRLQDLPVLARGLRRRAVEGPAGVGAAGGRRHRARRAAARGPADVRRRLSGDEPGDRRTRRRRADPAVPGQQGARRPASPCRSAAPAACSPRRCSSARWPAWPSAPSSTACSGPRSAHPRCTPSSRWAECSRPPPKPR